MIKKFLIIVLAVFVLLGCNNSSPRVSEDKLPPDEKKTNKRDYAEPVIAHSSDKQARTLSTIERSTGKKKWTRSGNPIDTSKFDEEIDKAERILKSKSGDEAAIRTVSEAYYKRGFALTEARQYASAIGDYRRALKYDPQNSDAKKWIAVIIGIYKSINREAPNEGEEPPPLEFNKDKA